jgi:hypothetical protein
MKELTIELDSDGAPKKVDRNHQPPFVASVHDHPLNTLERARLN